MSMDNSMMVFFLSMLATYSIVGFVWWLLHVVAAWRIFTKAGEAGWKSIIPIYSTYITYKISWKKKNLFWATLAATVLAFVLSPFSIQADGSINYAMFFIAMLLLLFAFVVNILLVVRKCRALAMAWALPSACFSLSRFLCSSSASAARLISARRIDAFSNYIQTAKGRRGNSAAASAVILPFRWAHKRWKAHAAAFPPRSRGSRS
ncbi:MAG: hypothetical protein ACLR7U_05835 [Ruthenibacterium lactatiformans]